MTDDPDKPDPLSDIFDRLLRGEDADVEVFIAGHDGLAASVVADLRGLAALMAAGPATAAPPNLTTPTQLGEFKLLRRLGTGGMGQVWLADQPSLGRQVAVKILGPFVVASREARVRFVREGRAIARLKHPGIVGAIGFGETGGIPWLAMEYVPGDGLDELIAAAADGHASLPPIADVVRWGRDVAEALIYLHARDLIHRDIKPANIRITPERRAVLLDFGLARDTTATTLSVAGGFHGSPYYASPEQVAPEGASIDTRTDVYSLGVTLYQALTGALPFTGDTATQVFSQILAGAARPPRATVPAIPRDLETVVLKAMERDRDRRYPTAADLAADLGAVAELRPVTARPPGALRRATLAARRHPGLTFAAALVVIVAVAVAVLGVRQRHAAADAAVRDARTQMTAFVTGRAAFAELSVALAALQRSQQSRRLTPAELQRCEELETARPAAEDAVDTAFAAAVAAARTADAADPGNADARAVLGDLYMTRWREVIARGDERAAAVWRREVEAVDSPGRHRDELAATGSVEIATDPPGAEVFLFRYEEQSQVTPGGRRRLVPVPVGGAPPVPPGTWCLRASRGIGDIDAGDLITSVAGVPIEGALFAIDDNPPNERLDRLVTIDGETPRDPFDVVRLTSRRGVATRPHTLVFDRRGEAIVRESTREKPAPIQIAGADFIARAGHVAARVWHDGAFVERDLPPGLDIRVTAAPAFASAACSLGVTPVARSLPRGSYLAVARIAGRAPVRAPFLVTAGARVELSFRVPPAKEAPAEYVYIPGGDTLLGSEHPRVEEDYDLRVRHLDGFWIMDHEVTNEAYFAFLNAPETLAEIERSPTPIRAPRIINEQRRPEALRKGADGRYALATQDLDSPIGGVTWGDATAFARWETARLHRRGFAGSVRLPEDLEWEKAARGADARLYPFGNVFNPTWTKSRYARDIVSTERIMRFPIDESPYGLFDMAGQSEEWCATAKSRETTHALRAGSTGAATADRFQTTYWQAILGPNTADTYGFRLVYDPPATPPATRPAR